MRSPQLGHITNITSFISISVSHVPVNPITTKFYRKEDQYGRSYLVGDDNVTIPTSSNLKDPLTTKFDSAIYQHVTALVRS